MRIRLRLIFTLSILLGLMGSQVFITVGLVSHLGITFADISQKHLVQIERINRINQKLVMTMADPARGMNSSSPEAVDLKEMDSLVASYKKNYVGSPEQLAALQDSYNEFKRNYGSFRHQIKNGLPPGGQTFSSLQDSYFSLVVAVNSLRDQNILQVREALASNYLVAKQTFYLLLIALCLVSVIGIVFGWYVARSFSQGLNTMFTAIRNVTKGDLSQPARWDNPDEFGHLAKAFNVMLGSLLRARQETDRAHEEALESRDERIQLLRQQLTETAQAQDYRETERQRMIQEIRQQTTLVLTTVSQVLSSLEQQMPASGPQTGEIAALKALTVSAIDNIGSLDSSSLLEEEDYPELL